MDPLRGAVEALTEDEETAMVTMAARDTGTDISQRSGTAVLDTDDTVNAARTVTAAVAGVAVAE